MCSVAIARAVLALIKTLSVKLYPALRVRAVDVTLADRGITKRIGSPDHFGTDKRNLE
jgi:hypothetical protein